MGDGWIAAGEECGQLPTRQVQEAAVSDKVSPWIGLFTSIGQDDQRQCLELVVSRALGGLT
jgi:hypothetical protein